MAMSVTLCGEGTRANAWALTNELDTAMHANPVNGFASRLIVY